MNKNWFKNEAKFMTYPWFGITMIALIVILLIPYIHPFDLETNSKELLIKPDFYHGLSLGFISSDQLEIVKDYGDVKYLLDKDLKDNNSQIKAKVISINSNLLSIAILLKDIPNNLDWPQDIKTTILIGTDSRKKFYGKLKKERINFNWKEEDPEKEKAINEVIDLYIKYGNPYKLTN